MLPTRKNQGWLPSIFNDFFDNTWMEKTNATAPAINIRETETNYEIEVAAPGMTREDFTIKIENNNLCFSSWFSIIMFFNNYRAFIFSYIITNL